MVGASNRMVKSEITKAKVRMREKQILTKLLKIFGRTFSESLGIRLCGKDSKEIFKWFLASILFGTRISEAIAINTYKQFEKERILSPDRILQTGWDGLVKILDDGGYVRYDFKTATKLLDIMSSLKKDYNADLNILHEKSRDAKDLEARIQDLGKGIGPVTCNIFLREMRPYWHKARPQLSLLGRKSARNLGLLESLKTTSRDFSLLEAALVRLGKDFCKKSRCQMCELKKLCKIGSSSLNKKL